MKIVDGKTYVLLVVVDQACVLEVRVEFDLVDGGGSGGRFEEPVEVLGEVVGHADGASEAGGFELFHLLPLGLVLFFLFAEEGGVDQVPGWQKESDVVDHTRDGRSRFRD